VIIFAPRISGPLMSVSDGGGTPAVATPAHDEDGRFTNRNPYFLPDGKHFLYVQRGGKDAVASVYASSIDAGQPRQILPVGSNVSYSDGYLFYVKDNTLIAQAFDPGSLALGGKPLPIATKVEYYNPRDMAYFATSQSVLVYRNATVENREMVWLNSDGKELDHWGEAAPYVGGSYSLGSQMSVLYRDNPSGRGNSLWLADTQRKNTTRLTPDGEVEQSAVISADGSAAFIGTTNGYLSTLVRRGLTAQGKEEKLLETNAALYVTSVSRDGRYLVFNEQDPKTSYDLLLHRPPRRSKTDDPDQDSLQ